VKKLLGRIKAFANSVVENAKVRKRMIAVPIYAFGPVSALSFRTARRDQWGTIPLSKEE
jgi:hypothetical protein